MDGEVLAAASVPTREATPPPDRDGERAGWTRERTLGQPRFQPPGSVLKPFVAAYALDRGLIDAATVFECLPLPGGGAGWQTLRCHESVGHRAQRVHDALAHSCNGYFAQLGERYDSASFLEMLHTFGFDEPTGVRTHGARSGLRDDHVAQGLVALRGHGALASLRRVANGLSHVTATPMQVARAMIGLVTGELPEMRFLRSIGAEAVPRASERLAIAPESRALVLRALHDVVHGDGSASGRGLDRAALGFDFACKTGSADYEYFTGAEAVEHASTSANKKMRKHAWIAGWFPEEQPRAVVVVYLHDTSETSSRTAVYVARQLLRTEAVRRYAQGTEQ
jgi:penicillin-binding protein 2